MTQGRGLEIRAGVDRAYSDVLTPEAVAALLRAAIARRAARRADAGADRAAAPPAGAQAAHRVPSGRRHDRRHRPHGRGRARRPVRRQRDPARPAAAVDSGHRARRRSRGAPVEKSIRNVAYALLSGADGWMFDGEDALGQVSTMSLDNQRNLKLAIARDPLFLQVAEQVAGEMNALGAAVLRPADRRRLAAAARLHDAGSSAPAACTSTTGTSAATAAPASRRRSSTPCSTS